MPTFLAELLDTRCYLLMIGWCEEVKSIAPENLFRIVGAILLSGRLISINDKAVLMDCDAFRRDLNELVEAIISDPRSFGTGVWEGLDWFQPWPVGRSFPSPDW